MQINVNQDEDIQALKKLSQPTDLSVISNFLSNPQCPSNQNLGILLTTGSLNPPHFQHFRIFDIAAKYLSKYNIDIIAGFLSPSADCYTKSKLGSESIPFFHRLNMCILAAHEHNSEMKSLKITIDPWEGLQDPVFIDFDEIRKRLSSIVNQNFPDANIKVFYLCGYDHFSRCRLSNWNNVVTVARGPLKIEHTNVIEKGIFICAELDDDISCMFNDISSTEMRKRRQQSGSLSDLTYPSVENYLKKIE
jgi:nicotinic acid mononucleotide adenylyltransferase